MEGMKYEIIFGKFFMNYDNKPLFDSDIFSESFFIGSCIERIRQAFAKYGDNFLSIADDGIEIKRDNEGKYLFTRITFNANGVSNEDMYSAVIPFVNDPYTFSEHNHFLISLLGTKYEDEAKKHFGENAGVNKFYARLSDIFELLVNSKVVQGFHALFCPLTKVEQPNLAELFKLTFSNPKTEDNKSSNCIWPGFIYGFDAICETIYTTTTDLYSYSPQIVIPLGSAFAKSHQIKGEGSFIMITDPENEYAPFDISDNFFVHIPVSENISDEKVSGSQKTSIKMRIKTTMSDDEIKSHIESDNFITDFVEAFSKISHENLAWYYEQTDLPQEERDEYLQWMTSNSDFLNNMTINSFKLKEYKIINEADEKFVDIEVHADIALNNVVIPFDFVSTAGVGAGAVAIAIMKMIAAIAVCATVIYAIVELKLGKLIEMWIKIIDDTPDPFKWIPLLLPLLLLAFLGFLIYKTIFRRHRK